MVWLKCLSWLLILEHQTIRQWHLISAISTFCSCVVGSTIYCFSLLMEISICSFFKWETGKGDSHLFSQYRFTMLVYRFVLVWCVFAHINYISKYISIFATLSYFLLWVKGWQEKAGRQKGNQWGTSLDLAGSLGLGRIPGISDGESSWESAIGCVET